MSTYLDLLPIATNAVNLAAELLRTHQPGAITGKGDRDMATDLDYTIERQVRALLGDRTPAIGFIGEEEGHSGDTTDLRWALDPIDGTANFIHGSPLCGVSLGLIHHDTPVLGVIALPFLGTRYTAVQGHGAHADGQEIHVSTTAHLHGAIVSIGDYAVGDGAEDKNRVRFAHTQRLAANVQRVRMLGSAAIDLAWLAHGRTDAIITMSNKPWDMAAGVIIAREAGATIMDKDGTPHHTHSHATIAANPALIPAILRLVRDAEHTGHAPS
jgi:myo-inositol-1(or 4)-monophosphatase